MIIEDFRCLFETVLDQSSKQAKLQTGRVVSQNFKYEIHGGGSAANLHELNDALDILYISEHIFWDTIDISIKKMTEKDTVVFVRISGEPPCTLENTWNYKNGLGPFKVMNAIRINLADYA